MADVCEICHENPVVGKHRGCDVCAECLEYGEYYDNLTPEEWRAEDAAMAAYVEESMNHA